MVASVSVIMVVKVKFVVEGSMLDVSVVVEPAIVVVEKTDVVEVTVGVTCLRLK